MALALAPQLELHQIADVCRSASRRRLEQYLPWLNGSLEEAQVDSSLRLAMYVAQLAQETVEYQRFEENLNYRSAETIRSVWLTRFPSLQDAEPYVSQAENLANRVYANRLGNGPPESGDGWRFRGRGAIQLTGRANYQAAGKALNEDLVAHPWIVSAPALCFRVAAWYWMAHHLNDAADAGDVSAATRLINGPALEGLQQRKKYFDRARVALGLLAASGAV